MNGNNALIPLIEGEIQGRGQHLCNARDLHAFLEVGKDFSNWVKDRIEQHGFIENQDFVSVEDLSSPNLASSKSRAQRIIEYHLTVEAAKHIAMTEHTPRGKEARDWFIECERIAFGSRDGLAIGTGPVGFYLPMEAEDYPVYASGVVNNVGFLKDADLRGSHLAVIFGTEQELLNIKQKHEEPPIFTGLMPLPSWIKLNRRHAMYAHAVEVGASRHIFPWVCGDPFTAESIIFVRHDNRSIDFVSMISAHGYSMHTLLSRPGRQAPRDRLINDDHGVFP